MSESQPRSALPVRWLLVAALAGFVARLAFGFGYWTDQPLTRDEQEYLSLARSLARGDGFVYDDALRAASGETFGRSPGYPWFIALVGGGAEVVTSVPAALKIAQSLVGAVGVVLLGVIAHRLAGARAAAAAACISAVYPPLVWVAGYALSEAIFWPLALVAVILFDRARNGGYMGAALCCGLTCGAAILVRPSLLLFVPLALAVLLVRRQWLTAAAIVAGVALAVAPWVVRNYAVHGRVVLAASTGGVNFWIGNHPLAIGEGDMAANPSIKIDNARLRAGHPGMSEEAMEPIYYAEAIRWIRTNPADWVLLELKKVFYLVVPTGPSYALHSARYQIASIVPYLVMVVAAAAAVRVRHWAASTAGLWVLLGSAVLSALIFFPQERFRIPIIDPALIALASVYLGSIGARGMPRREKVH